MINNKGRMAIAQIIILVIGIVGFAWMLGGINAAPTASYNYNPNTGKMENSVNIDISGIAKTPIPVSLKNTVAKSIYTSVEQTTAVDIKTGKDIIVATNTQVNVKGDVGTFKSGGQEYTISSKEITIENGFNQGTSSDIGSFWKGGTDRPWFSTGSYSGALVSGVLWAAGAAGIAGLITLFYEGPEGSNFQTAFTASAALGAFAGKSAYDLMNIKGGSFSTGSWGSETTFGFSNNALVGGGIGIAAALITYAIMYKETSQEIVSFECYAWDAPQGGSKCEECNSAVLPCSEYQCRSLGQSCKIINSGTTDSKCVWENRNDVEPPVITVNENELSSDYKYTPDNAISPPDRGIILKSKVTESECIPAFSSVDISFTTNEPAKCKVDYIRTSTMDTMKFYFGGESIFDYNHTQTLRLPSSTSLKASNSSEQITIQNDGFYKFYVRCADSNGNSNTGTFVFKTCVDDGPDATAPQIVATSINSGSPIAYNTTTMPVELYINEPLAGCKWDILDKEYTKMDNSMTCSTSATEMNTQMLYTCKSTLTGLKSNGATNNFYFRCEDQSNNTNSESYKMTLMGTSPLTLDKITPNNETVKDASSGVKVTLSAKTSAGYKNGEAICHYSLTGETKDYIQFFNSGSYENTQYLYLTEGEYNIAIKCIDLGGNAAYGNANFIVDTDTEAPTVIRAYHEQTSLKLITDEESTCVYNSVSCNYQFKDGILLTTFSKTQQYTNWDISKNFYIKCKDSYENQPGPDECSIIVRPAQIE